MCLNSNYMAEGEEEKRVNRWMERPTARYLVA